MRSLEWRSASFRIKSSRSLSLSSGAQQENPVKIEKSCTGHMVYFLLLVLFLDTGQKGLLDGFKSLFVVRFGSYEWLRIFGRSYKSCSILTRQRRRWGDWSCHIPSVWVYMLLISCATRLTICPVAILSMVLPRTRGKTIVDFPRRFFSEFKAGHQHHVEAGIVHAVVRLAVVFVQDVAQ